jgi:hypothetical protein
MYNSVLNSGSTLESTGSSLGSSGDSLGSSLANGSSSSPNIRISPEIITNILGFLENLPPTEFVVSHIRKGKVAHHSHIRIRTILDKPVLNIGLFNAKGNASIVGREIERMGYSLSLSYEPNPITISKSGIISAFSRAVSECGGKYGLYSNNCQKFGRTFMTELGVTHVNGFLKR